MIAPRPGADGVILGIVGTSGVKVDAGTNDIVGTGNFKLVARLGVSNRVVVLPLAAPGVLEAEVFVAAGGRIFGTLVGSGQNTGLKH